MLWFFHLKAQTPTQSSCDLADDSLNLRWAISLDNWHKMLLLLVYQIFVHTKIIANLLFLTSCVKHFKRCGVQREVGTRSSVETNYKWLYRTLQRFTNEGCMAERWWLFCCMLRFWVRLRLGSLFVIMEFPHYIYSISLRSKRLYRVCTKSF